MSRSFSFIQYYSFTVDVIQVHIFLCRYSIQEWMTVLFVATHGMKSVWYCGFVGSKVSPIMRNILSFCWSSPLRWPTEQFGSLSVSLPALVSLLPLLCVGVFNIARKEKDCWSVDVCTACRILVGLVGLCAVFRTHFFFAHYAPHPIISRVLSWLLWQFHRTYY